MALVKCPRCELNYMLDTDKMCSVCRKEVRGESEQYETVELCSECGENPVVPGQELCAYCLKELTRRNEEEEDQVVAADPSSIAIDSVSTMEEIEIDLDESLDGEPGMFDGDDDDDDDKDEDEV